MNNSLVFDVGHYGAFLASRSKAKTVRSALEDQIDTLDSAGKVVLDFNGVEAMAIDFADEFLGRFYGAVAGGDVTAAILMCGMNESNQETIEICLERRNLIAAAVTTGGKVQLLGAPDYLNETFCLAVELGSFRATDLAERLDAGVPTMNNRLKRLMTSGIFTRQTVTQRRGGNEYAYSVADVIHANRSPHGQ